MAAMEQLEHNKALLKPGLSFREWSEKAWPIPDEFLASRYGVIAHGVGLVDEYPAIMPTRRTSPTAAMTASSTRAWCCASSH